jgi:hypothetical protein
MPSTGSELRTGLARWIAYYNGQRPSIVREPGRELPLLQAMPIMVLLPSDPRAEQRVKAKVSGVFQQPPTGCDTCDEGRGLSRVVLK